VSWSACTCLLYVFSCQISSYTDPSRITSSSRIIYLSLIYTLDAKESNEANEAKEAEEYGHAITFAQRLSSDVLFLLHIDNCNSMRLVAPICYIHRFVGQWPRPWFL
jgi:hypothetical protein